MVTTRYSDQQGSKLRQKVMRLGKQWHRPISKRFIKPPYSISRAASIDSDCCRLPTTSVLNGQTTLQPALINKSKFRKATHRTKIRKIEIPRSMVAEAATMFPASRVPPPSRRAPNWSSEGAHTWEHHLQRVSNDRPNRKGSQLAASLEGELGPTPAGNTLPHSYSETRFRRERARDKTANTKPLHGIFKRVPRWYYSNIVARAGRDGRICLARPNSQGERGRGRIIFPRSAHHEQDGQQYSTGGPADKKPLFGGRFQRLIR